MSKPRYILDTGPLVAYANARDLHHQWACSVLDALAETPVLPDIVVAEACWLLRSSKRAVRGILELTESGAVQVVHLFGPDQPPIAEMMDKYWPRMDLADACVLALADRIPGSRVITTDYADFTLYRLKNGKQVPIIVPASE